MDSWVILEEQQAEIDSLKNQLIQKDKELVEAVKQAEDARKDTELWKERYKAVRDLKNEIRTNNYVSRTLTEVDMAVMETPMYNCLMLDVYGGTPGKRVELTDFGKRREKGMPMFPPEAGKGAPPAAKKAREGSALTVAQIHTLLDRYFSKPDLKGKGKKRAKLLAASYNTGDGFQSPDDEAQFGKLENELDPSDEQPIVAVFREVVRKLREPKFVFGKTAPANNSDK